MPRHVDKVWEQIPSRINGTQPPMPTGNYLEVDHIHRGDSRKLLGLMEPDSVALSFWSPPYFVGKSYEKGMTFEGWQALLATVIGLHVRILKPGGFVVVNIADILCFADPELPRVQAETHSGNRMSVTRDDIMRFLAK